MDASVKSAILHRVKQDAADAAAMARRIERLRALLLSVQAAVANGENWSTHAAVATSRASIAAWIQAEALGGE